jgi:DNA-binding CsgD family transcriptional regulator
VATWSHLTPLRGPELSSRLRGQIAELLTRASDLIGTTSPGADRMPTDQIGARETLDRVWDLAIQRLTPGGLTPAALAQVADLLGQVRAGEEALRGEEQEHWSRRQRAVSPALALLGEGRTGEELARLVPRSAARIGFDRVMLSRVDQDRWVPEAVFVAGDEHWARRILDAGRADPRTLDDSLLETRMVRHRAGLVVVDTDGLTNLHQALITVSRSRSYVAAPVVTGGAVTGFVHADHHHKERRVTAADQDLLRLYCDGLAHLLTRARALKQIEALRFHVDAALTRTPPGPTAGPWTAPPATDAPRPPATPPAAPSPATLGSRTASGGGVLSAREIEVVEMMSQGLTNEQISRQMFIGVGTVKTHVKHILRKFEASNRAEAVSIWLRGRR